MLLHRLVKTAATAEIVHAALDRDPAGASSSGLTRQLTALNASVATLSRQLRLSPMQEIATDAAERRTERGTAADPLLGGYAVHGRGNGPSQ